MTHRGPFQPLTFCDSVTKISVALLASWVWYQVPCELSYTALN